MWFLFARCIRRRRAKREANAQCRVSEIFYHLSDDSVDKSFPDPQCERSAEKKEILEKKADPERSMFWFGERLLTALLLPVFLETLDYTSRVSIHHVMMLVLALINFL